MENSGQTRASRQAVVRELRTYLVLCEALTPALTAAAIWLFVWGAVVLALRFLQGVAAIDLVWGLTGAPVALLVTGYFAWRERPGDAMLGRVLDSRSNCGGMLAAEYEGVDVTQWQSRMPEVTVPEVRWRDRRVLWLLVSSMLFAALGFGLPQPDEQSLGRPMQLGEIAESLGSQIDVMEEEDAIEEVEANELRDELQRIEDSASGRDPSKTWEALDHLSEALQREAGELADAGAESLARADAAAQLADAIEETRNQDPGADLTKAMQELGKALHRMRTENQAMAGDLSQELIRAASEQLKGLSPEQIRELRKSLGKCSAKTRQTLKRLAAKGLIDPQKLAQALRKGAADPKAMAELLQECGLGKCAGGGDGQGNEGMAGFGEGQPGNVPGRGGVNRGPGTAPITWSGTTDEFGAAFKEQRLPDTAAVDFSQSELKAITAEAPVVGDAAPDGVNALGNADDGGGAAVEHRILPRHRGAVQRYFSP